MAKQLIKHPERFNENYTEEDRDNLKTIIDWMNDSEARTNSWLAKTLSCSDAYISQLLKGTLPVAAEKFIRGAMAAIETADKVINPGDFVLTSTWTKFRYACNLVKSQKGFAVFAGAPGIGKSSSIKHYHQTVDPNCIVITGSKSTSCSTLLIKLLKELNIKTKYSSNDDRQEAIIEALSETNRLLILDETDKCKKDVPEPLRTISDEAGIGVVLVGNVDLRNQVKLGKHHYDLISDRVVYWPKPIHQLMHQDIALLMRPYIKDSEIDDHESFEDLSLYAGQLVEGSGRKLVKSLMVHVSSYLELQRKKKLRTVVNRTLLRQIATEMMGIDNPPPVTRKSTTQIPVTAN